MTTSLSGARPIRSTLVGSRRITLGSRRPPVVIPPATAGAAGTGGAGADAAGAGTTGAGAAGTGAAGTGAAGTGAAAAGSATTGLAAMTVGGRAGFPVEHVMAGPSTGCPSLIVVSPSRVTRVTLDDPT